MKELEQIFFKKQEHFRKWLGKNYDKSPGIWLIFYKKHTNILCPTYREALEEALCYGWIDSTVKRIDDESYIRKFSPRRNISNWSEVNKKLVNALIAKGKMTEEGLRKIDIYLKTGKLEWEYANSAEKEKRGFDIPAFILEEFAKNEPALRNFNNFAKSYQHPFIFWITNAKREETIQKRLKESIVLLKENKKLGLK